MEAQMLLVVVGTGALIVLGAISARSAHTYRHASQTVIEDALANQKLVGRRGLWLGALLGFAVTGVAAAASLAFIVLAFLSRGSLPWAPRAIELLLTASCFAAGAFLAAAAGVERAVLLRRGDVIHGGKCW